MKLNTPIEKNWVVQMEQQLMRQCVKQAKKSFLLFLTAVWLPRDQLWATVEGVCIPLRGNICYK